MNRIIPLKVLQGSSTTQESREPVASAPFGRTAPVVSPTGGEKHVELSSIHDFASKLTQPDLLPRLKAYVRWYAEAVRARGEGHRIPQNRLEDLMVPDFAPVSINLDITTACNYACDHCVDMDILNQGIKYNHENLMKSLELMVDRGLKSVIVIGGGEPTLYPKFEESLRFMKSLGLQVSIVSNGSGQKKIAAVADCLDETDWVRLSLDSASEDVFQRMHKPKRPITLDEICAGVPEIKAINPRFKIGFSFIITWKGAYINDTDIVENLPEIVPGAERARDYQFDYISFKPFLTRAPDNNAEIVDLRERDTHFAEIVTAIRKEIDEAQKLETDSFKVYETTNLKVLENRSYKNYTQQPHHCHMQFFRQVLSPLGMYNCPVYRNQPHGFLGTKEAYSDEPLYGQTRTSTADLIENFDATEECQEVTCLYNHVNWWIEHLIEHPEELDTLKSSELPEPDYFL